MYVRVYYRKDFSHTTILPEILQSPSLRPVDDVRLLVEAVVSTAALTFYRSRSSDLHNKPHASNHPNQNAAQNAANHRVK